jgi:hypothetical protein
MTEDHLRLENRLAHIVEMAKRDKHEAMPALWIEFDARARAHLGAEERHLLPALLRWRRRDARAIVEEHKLIRRRLDELATAIRDRVVKVNDLRRFLDELSAHGRMENQRVYQWADEHFNPSAKDVVLAEMARAMRVQTS